MSFHCCVPQCVSDARYNKDLSFHRFPPLKDKELRGKWIAKIRRDVGPHFQIGVAGNTRVCSKHFKEDDFRPRDNNNRRLLKPGVVPSVFDWSTTSKKRRKIMRHAESDVTQADSDNNDGAEGTDTIDELDKLKSELEVAKEEAEAARQEAQAVAELAQKEQAAAKQEIELLKAQLHDSVPKIYKFGIERFSKDDEQIKFYTGFPTYQHFHCFYEVTKPCAERMTYVYSAGIQESRPGARTMLIIDELFLFLVRVRLGLFAQDLADRFLIHISSVSRKITTWANYLYFFLGSQPIWPSREQVDYCMPDDFKQLYPKTRVILDCTEIHVQTPSSLLLQSQMYSTYKSGTTLKGLLGIAPHGAVTFVSALHTGSISDKEITRCSGILDLLEPGDSVMADKGFDIESLLNTHGVNLNLPPFLQTQSQFTCDQVIQTKTVAKLRIHVERAIRRIKEFHIFDSDVPLNLLGSINQIYTVVCLLTNFQGPLIMKAAK